MGTESQAAGSQYARTLQGMTEQLERLRFRIRNTSTENTEQLKKLSTEYNNVKTQVDALNKSLLEQQKTAKGVGDSFQSIYNTFKLIVTAGIVREIGQMALSMATLQGNIEGVSAAFNKIPNATLLLQNLRRATHGTVDDLSLMQTTLKAQNFKIPLEQLGTLLEFANVRAQQTGQSVQYMVDSIVLGLGYNSIRRLDNVGLSVADLKKKMDETGLSLRDAFGLFVQDEIKKMGGYIETAKTEVEQLNKEAENLRQTLAKNIDTGWFAKFLKEGIGGINNLIRGQKDLNKEMAAEEVNSFLRAKQSELAIREKIGSTIQNEIDRRKNLVMSLRDEIAQTEATLVKDFGTKMYYERGQRLRDYLAKLKEEQDITTQSIPLLQDYMQTQIRKINGDQKEIETIETMQQKLELLQDEYRKGVDFGDRVAYIAKAKEIRLLQDEIKRREELMSLHAQENQAIEESTMEYEKMQKSMEELIKIYGVFRKQELIPTIETLEDTPEPRQEVLNKWQKFFALLRNGFKQSSDEAVDFEELANEIMATGVNIVSDQLQANADFEIALYDKRIQKANEYYDRLIGLSGDNERRQKELELRRDEEIKKHEKQKEQAEQRAARRKAIIEGAGAIIKTFNEYGFTPQGIVAAALMAAQTISQLAIISRAPKGYAKGVIGLNGPGTPTSDSIPAMLSRGESVMTAEETRQNWKTLHKIRAGKINDKVIDKIMAGQIVVGSDDHQTAAKLDELIKITKSNRPPDYVERAGMLYRVKQKSDTSRQYIRSKYGF